MHRKMLSYFVAIAVAMGVSLAHAETYTATNVVVAPLTDAHWTQGAPYNLYTPHSSWHSGCEAISSSQELLVWQWPWSLGAIHTASHFVNGESDSVVRFDGSVPIDWDSLKTTHSESDTLREKHAASRLSLMCQSLLQMQYVSGGADAKKQIPGTMEWYEYVGSVKPNANGGDDAAVAAIREDFEFGSPVQVGVPQHAVVGLGYATGTNSVGTAVDLIWLNYGWGGGSDGWYDLRSTEHYADSGLLYTASPIQNVHVGFRPIKSVQIEPVAPVSGSNVTLNWHLPNCYTNKIDGFTVATKKMSEGTITWADDFSEYRGRSSNTNEMRIANGGLMAWQAAATAIYTYDDVFIPTAESVLTYDLGSGYMYSMDVRIEIRVNNGAWETLHTCALEGGASSFYKYGGRDVDMTKGISVSLAGYEGKRVQVRIVAEYTKGGLTNSSDANMRLDNLSISNVKTFEVVATDSTIAASARSTTFSGLEDGETYAFSVTPIMSDGSAAVTQTVATLIGTPAATPVINSVTMSPKGSDLVQEGFYADIAIGWNIIDVACSESVTKLEAFISHQSVLPQSKIEVVDNGSGSFSINIDATEVAAKWADQKMILTLKATNATGESAYKDVELCLKASGVPENIPGGKVWTGASAMFGAENYTAKWSGNVLPTDGDKVTFKTTDADLGGEMNLNLSTSTTLGYVYATGLGQLTISGASSETLTANVLKNDIQVEINSSKFKVNKVIPSANIVIDNGSSLDCEIDQARSGWIKKATYGYPSALTDSSLWNGTVVFSGYSADWLNPSSYGNTSSKVRFNGVAGYLAHSNPTFNPTIELVDNGSTPAFDWNNGSSASTATFKGISGDGTFKTSGSSATSERIVINDIGSFTGSFNLASKVVTIGTTKGTDASNGRLNFNSGYGATIAGGKTWTIGGGVYLAGNQTLTVNGALSDSGALAAEGTGTVLALAPTATVTAASLSFANNTIRLAKTAETSPTFSVSGAAILTNATIEVTLADGMSAGDSIALMSAGSFEGIDTATLSGLDGYSLAVEDGILYAKMDECVYTGPEPTAVWEAGEFKRTKNGYSIELNDNTIDADGNIVIDDAATIGAVIDIASVNGNVENVTVLVKYASYGAQSAITVPIASYLAAAGANNPEVGIATFSAGNPYLIEYYKVNNYSVSWAYLRDSEGNENKTALLASTGGYVMMSYDRNTVHGYTGSEISSLAGGSTNIVWAGSRKFQCVSVGGPTGRVSPNGYNGVKGMVIEKIALFVNEALTNEDIADYQFPDLPIDPDDYAVTPAAVWCKDFKTVTKGDYTLTTSGSTVVASDKYGSTLTIGDKAAEIAIPEPTRKFTVLVKYLAAPVRDSQDFFVCGCFTNGASKVDNGLISAAGSSSDLIAAYEKDKTITAKGLGSTTITPSTAGGYILVAHDAGGNLSVYAGDTFKELANTSATIEYKFTGWYYTSLAVGGPSGMLAENSVGAWDGLVVEKIAIFNDYYTPSDLIVVENPEDADILSIGSGATWNFAAGETKTYTKIGTLDAGGTIAITNAATLGIGVYKLAEWITPQQFTATTTGYGRVGNVLFEGLNGDLAAELVYGARAIYLRVYDPVAQAKLKTLTIWPYGDSITEGFNGQHTGANYRILLYQKLRMLGFNVKSAGVYGLNDGYNSIDPSGVPLSDTDRWHSAKHGGTVGPTTNTKRSNECENVDTLCAQVGTPDVVLLHIGSNDLNESVTNANKDDEIVNGAFKAWSNVVSRLVKNLPATKIIVSTGLDGVNSTRARLNERMHAYNTCITNLVHNLPEDMQGHVYLANLYDYVDSQTTGILYTNGGDNLHPDWWGHDQMAEGWLSVITNQFSKTDNFVSAEPIPAAPEENQLGAAAKNELSAYLEGFKRYAVLNADKNILPTLDTAIPYTQVNDEAATTALEKVGYFVEYVRDDNHAHRWVWVDMDAFGITIEDVGLPKAKHRQKVSNLHVKSNHGGIDNVEAYTEGVEGWIEFSPFDYGRAPSNVDGAPADNGSSSYDWNDTLNDSGSLACMQVFRVAPPSGRPAQVLFAYNNWRDSGSEAEFGIGNFSQHFSTGNDHQSFDYSTTKSLDRMNATNYVVKTIEIWTKAAEAAPVVAQIGDESYASLAEALETVTGDNPVAIMLVSASGENVTLPSNVTVTEESAGLYTGTLSGSGTLVLAGKRTSQMSFGTWTGIVVLPPLAENAMFNLAYHGKQGSTIRLSGISNGWLFNGDNTVDAIVEIPNDVTATLKYFGTGSSNIFAALKGAGKLEFTSTQDLDLSYPSYSPYFLIKDVSQFTGKLSTANPSIVVGAQTKPERNTGLYPGKIVVYGKVTACDDWTASSGIVLADAAATLTVEEGVTVSTVGTTLPGYGVVRNGNVYSVEQVTDTAYPVPYSWFVDYGIMEAFSSPEQKAANGQTSYWESYVLGLDPTNETSKFTVSIRMDGTTPIVEYSPTNETIAIQYVLQGNPGLAEEGWSDCESFNEPGDTNRFFRVKVKW